jgi:hypothetical protein
MLFRVDNDTKMTILSGGNVGIGTTTPSEKLHVVTTALFGPNGSTSRSTDGVGINFTNNNTFSANADLTDANRYLAITNDSTTANAYAPLSFRVHPDGSTSNAMADIKLVSNGSSHHLTTTIRNPATGNFIDTISIAQDGNVGIGTTSPGHRLDVYRDRIALTGLTAGTGGHYIALSGQLPGYTANQYNCLETNLTDLHFAAGGTYTGYISHNGGFTDVSDASLKENIQDIPDALNKVINLRGRYFTWKNELQSDNTQIGFIAQEVEEYVPEVVTSGAGGIKGIAYGKMTALLVNAIKELKADNDNLRERIQTLENQ